MSLVELYQKNGKYNKKNIFCIQHNECNARKSGK